MQLAVHDVWLESGELGSRGSSTSTFTSSSHGLFYIFSLFLFFWGNFAAVGPMVWISGAEIYQSAPWFC
jgi:hypothetical protein